MKKLILLLAVVIGIAVGTANAQQPAARPVKWTITTHMIDDFAGTLSITATPDEGWHLYGMDLPEGGPQPTSFDLSGSTGVEFRGKIKPDLKPKTVQDPLFGIKLNWWERPVTFSIRFVLKHDKHNPRIKAKVRYMACDDNTCAPPVTETLFKTVKLKR